MSREFEMPQRFTRLFGIAALAGVSLLAALATPAQAATTNLYAAPTAVGSGDCSSPANACPIATAVTNANAAPVVDDVRIGVAGGTYSLPAPSPTALPITFAGPSLTIEAEGGTPILDGANTVRLLSVGATSKVTISGLTIQSGAAAGLGGGIENAGTLTVRKSTFSGNTAGNGGGIGNTGGATLTVEDSTFFENKTTGVGGGAIISVGKATVVRSALINNQAPINGGGINIQATGVVTVVSSTVAGNTSGSLGGGLSNLGVLTVEASTLTGNTGSAGSAIAGAGAEKVKLAASIVGAQVSGIACWPNIAAFVDAGYNLDSDGTCISEESPAEGSHNGKAAYGSSTYGAALDAYLADAPAANGGPTQTVALLNSPNPPTGEADPAFDVVPPSFNLPVAVDGISATCSLPDQRSVVPVAGAKCDIGAYLLQPTKTELITPATTAKQKSPVTYTATVSPVPDGGTVAFDDGPGNPATAQCAAQSVSNGRATCTVSYPNIGVYSVKAAYSGDGAKNSFVGSTSAASTTTTVVDGTPPGKPGKLKGRIRHKKTLRLSWKASQDNVGVAKYQVLRKGKVVKSTTAKVRRVSIRLAGKGGAYAVRAVDALDNAGPLSAKVVVRRVPGETKAYRIVKKKTKKRR
jgi:Bacterial Ig-like domain (group 3)